jgi:hypothetical protein
LENGIEVDACYASKISDIVARTHTYEISIALASDRSTAVSGIPSMISLNSDDLYHGKDVNEDGVVNWVWVRLRPDNQPVESGAATT